MSIKGYPGELLGSIARAAESRQARMNVEFPRLTPDQKSDLLASFHPDYRLESKRELRLGPNRGEKVPQELADLLEGKSRIDPGRFCLDHADYETDVLVVGGGGAGCTAALEARERGARVLFATKLRLGDSNTIMAEGGIAAATEPEDSPMLHYLDTLGGGRYENVPELVEALVLDAPLVVEWLENLGVVFDRRPDGSILTHAPGGHCRRRSHSCKDLTGLEIMRVLRDEVRNKDIEVLEFCPLVELILDESGNCAGAILYNFDNQEYLIVRAGAVILATGGMGRLHINRFPTSNHYGATADGLVVAYRAGAPLLYVDAVQYHPTGVAWPEQMLGYLITEALRAHGAHLINARGERFVNELETRDAVASAIIRECREGRGVTTPTGTEGVWLDTAMIDIIGGRGKMAHQFTGICKRFASYGIDVTKDPILVYPTQHYQNGGVKHDSRGKTGLPGLFVAGEVGGGVHGRNRLGANSLVDIFVFGRRAGETAALHAIGAPRGKMTLDHVSRFHGELSEAGIGGPVLSPLLIPDYLSPESKARKY